MESEKYTLEWLVDFWKKIKTDIKKFLESTVNESTAHQIPCGTAKVVLKGISQLWVFIF